MLQCRREGMSGASLDREDTPCKQDSLICRLVVAGKIKIFCMRRTPDPTETEEHDG